MDVTVISTSDTMPAVVPVILKVVAGVLVVFEDEKNATVPPSGFAVTSILTPPDGMADLIVTVKGKSGPGAAGSTCPFARGSVSTTRLSSFDEPF